MLFVTWNVNSLRARLPRVLELLERTSRMSWRCRRPSARRTTSRSPSSTRPATTWSPSSGGQWAGVALLVRRPLAPDLPLLGLPGDAVPTEARWCEATVAGIRFVSTYVPNGRTLDSPEFPRKLEFMEAAAKRAAAIRTQGALGW